MKIHVSELEGRALDWAVGLTTGRFNDTAYASWEPVAVMAYRPSTEPGYFAPLLSEYKFDVYWHQKYDGVESWTCEVSMAGDYLCDPNAYDPVGPTFLVAACRAVVAANLGEEVEIPDELVK